MFELGAPGDRHDELWQTREVLHVRSIEFLEQLELRSSESFEIGEALETVFDREVGLIDRHRERVRCSNEQYDETGYGAGERAWHGGPLSKGRAMRDSANFGLSFQAMIDAM